jgi:hypothetical protein
MPHPPPDSHLLVEPIELGDLEKIETPVISMQDLEHVANPQTRVSNKGVKIEPTLDARDQRNFELEDEAAIQALEELERQIRRQPPG